MRKTRRVDGVSQNNEAAGDNKPKRAPNPYRGKWWNDPKYSIEVEESKGWSEPNGYTVDVKEDGKRVHTLAMIFSTRYRTDNQALRLAEKIACNPDAISGLRKRGERGIIDRRKVVPGGLVPLVWEEPDEGDPEETGKARITLCIEPPGDRPAVEVRIVECTGVELDKVGIVAMTEPNSRRGVSESFVLLDVPRRQILVGADAPPHKIGDAVWRAVHYFGYGSSDVLEP